MRFDRAKGAPATSTTSGRARAAPRPRREPLAASPRWRARARARACRSAHRARERRAAHRALATRTAAAAASAGCAGGGDGGRTTTQVRSRLLPARRRARRGRAARAPCAATARARVGRRGVVAAFDERGLENTRQVILQFRASKLERERVLGVTHRCAAGQSRDAGASDDGCDAEEASRERRQSYWRPLALSQDCSARPLARALASAAVPSLSQVPLARALWRISRPIPREKDAGGSKGPLAGCPHEEISRASRDRPHSTSAPRTGPRLACARARAVPALRVPNERAAIKILDKEKIQWQNMGARRRGPRRLPMRQAAERRRWRREGGRARGSLPARRRARRLSARAPCAGDSALASAAAASSPHSTTAVWGAAVGDSRRASSSNGSASSG